MVRSRSWGRGVRVLAAAAVLAVIGCGGSEPSTPVKQGELSEQEKRQIKELDAQRQDEWGKKKK